MGISRLFLWEIVLLSWVFVAVQLCLINSQRQTDRRLSHLCPWNALGHGNDFHSFWLWLLRESPDPLCVGWLLTFQFLLWWALFWVGTAEGWQSCFTVDFYWHSWSRASEQKSNLCAFKSPPFLTVFTSSTTSSSTLPPNYPFRLSWNIFYIWHRGNIQEWYEEIGALICRGFYSPSTY